MRKREEYAINFLTKLLDTYSPSGEEEPISNLLFQEMKNLGLKTRRDKVGNVIGEFGTAPPSVLLCGHMDTVPGIIPIRTEDGRLYGRGAVDAKSSLAAMIIASALLVDNDLPGKVITVGVVDEEGKGKGTKQLIKELPQVDYAIFGEPSGVENITIAYKGSLHLKITCKTETGHSAAPWLYENAIERAFDIWELIKNSDLGPERQGSRFYSITRCITSITGGGVSSTVPSKCDIRIDIRMPPGQNPQQVFDIIDGLVEQYKTDHPKVSVELEVEDACEPYESHPRSTLVRSLSWSVRRVRSQQVTLLRKTGTGDMNLLGSTMKVPVVTYGPGDSHLDHTPNEFIEITEYLDSIEVYHKTVKRLFELYNRGKEE
jgi:LysW-gamma-L-lysine carboxypeptidase